MTPRVDFPPSLLEELVSRLPQVPEAHSLIGALVGDQGGVEEVGVDRRRLAVSAESYEDLMGPVAEAVDAVLWAYPDDAVDATREHMLAGLARMARAAREADLAGEPPATAMEVVGVRPLFGASQVDFWSVHLSAPVPVEYEAGQVFPVLRPEAVEAATYAEDADPTWDCLAPAIPQNSFGELVFFLPAAGTTWAPRVGEYWTLGRASGEAVTLSGTIDARGDALAGARAAVFAAAERGAGEAVELLVDAAGVDEPGLRALADTSDWLTLTQVY